MKIFLGGAFSSKPRLRIHRQQLQDLGFRVLASWLDTPHNDTLPVYSLALTESLRDISEVKEADAFVLDTIDLSTSGGSYTEWGLFLGKSGPSLLVGPVRNIYHVLASRRFESWDELIKELREWNR